METRSYTSDLGRTAILMIIIGMMAMIFGMMAELARQGNLWGIGGIIALIAAAIMAGTLRGKGGAFVRR